MPYTSSYDRTRSTHDRLKITLPEGEVDGLRVERFEMKPYDLDNMREALRTERQTTPGWYTRLYDATTKTMWMSDVDAEKRDHWPAVQAIQREKAERVLIQGLGLGMVLAAALSYDHVTHVDVIEKDERVIKLVGPHYNKDPRVHLHHADAWDAMESWPRGTRWDVGWSDIWLDLCTDQIPEQDRMNRFYRRRCAWHQCWARDVLAQMRRRERAEERRLAEFYD